MRVIVSVRTKFTATTVMIRMIMRMTLLKFNARRWFYLKNVLNTITTAKVVINQTLSKLTLSIDAKPQSQKF